ncbi:histone acetyltransferase TAF1/250, partial [Toxoplasma gondii VAND]
RADQLVHAERQVKGRLGPFGELQLQQDDAKLTLFGTRLPLARGQGQAVAESPLLKAPVYVHPTAPNAPVKRDSRFHDYRDTDFILVRTRAKDRCKVYLRPLLYPPPEKNSAREGFSFYRSGGSLESLSVLGSPANCGVYTVGQCEPRMEVHAPNSKKHVEDRKLHAKAWALRFAAEKNVTDMKRVKDLVKQRFCPPVVEKEVTQMLKLLSPIAPHRLPRLDDAALRSIIRPELICCLEAAHAALFRLKAIGIMTLTSADGLAGVAQFIEKEERHAQEKVLAAKKRLKEIEMKFRQQAEARLPAAGGKDADLRAQSLEAANAACQRAHAALSSVCTAYAESRIGKRYGHLVRFIEELLLLTPWNLTKECKDVLTNKGSAQFMLSGFGDPSGGRGEGISLIKRLNRERAGLSFLSGASRNFGFSRDGARSLAGAFGPGGIFLGAHLGAAAGGGVAGTGEDLRKLSMQELRRRLVQYGLSESVIRTLPRWDQVALVRQYRDGFGNADFENEEEGKKAKGGLAKTGRLRGEEYEERLTDILQRQKKALEADAPAITDTEDEGEEDAARENAADVDLLEEQKAKKGKKVTKDEERHKAHAKKVGTASPGNLANGDPNHGQDKGVEDALLAALDGEEEEKEADEDELERRELQALRQRQEARAAKPLTAEEQQRADMKVQAVPCLRWIRRFRQQAGEPFATERVVLIYGEKNIRNFIQWRTKRLEDTRARMLASTRSKEALAGKRVCRACGQPGHIASNVNCPLYSGPKRPAAALTPPPPVKKRRKENLQLEEDLLMGLCPEGENESEVNAFGLSQTSGTPGRQRAGGAASSGGRGRSARGAVWEEEDEFGDAASSLVSYSRRRAGTRSAGSIADGHTQFFGGKAGEAGGRKKASRRRGAGGGGGGRGRESLEEEEERTQDEEDEEEERWTPERNRRSAIDELNIALARIVNVVLQQQIFKPFWQRVDERYAPNYYRVIANPMWLQKIASKCKQREYVSGEQFLADVRLVVTNCFLFNPPNSPSAWLRERATNLEETVRQKFEEQRATVAECEAVIMSHGVGITGMAADGVAAHMGYPMM